MQPVATRIVACPKCGEPVEWREENRYRPFCSARCKGIDLGDWASEQYRVAGSADPGLDGEGNGEPSHQRRL